MSYIGQKPAERILTSADISDAAITADKLASSSITQPKVNSGVAGTGPAFSAYQNATTSIAASTATKISFQVEEFDTNNNFASSTFTPTVAGYYQVNATANYLSGTSTGTNAFLSIFKNGSEYKRGVVNAAAVQPSLTVSGLVYCNGTTDYVEIYGFQS